MKESSCLILNLSSKLANLVALQMFETLQNDFADIKHQLIADLTGCNKQVIPGVVRLEINYTKE